MSQIKPEDLPIPATLAELLNAVDIINEKISRGWTNSFQATEIGKLTSRISDLLGRVTELEKLKPLTLSDTPITYQDMRLGGNETIVDLLAIKEASENLLAHIKEQEALSVPLLNALWRALGNEETVFCFDTYSIRVD